LPKKILSKLKMRATSRIAAASVAATAWIGLAVQCFVLFSQNSSLLLTLWVVLGFFTITTNLLVAVVFSGIALDRSRLRSGWVVAGTMLSILLVGIVYALLLHGLNELTGGSAAANVLLHMVTPVMVPLYWLLFRQKGNLEWKHPLLWALYPLAYLVYALVRGAATGKYPYPFLNVAALGWQRTALNAACIAAGFLLAGFAIVWLDVWLDRRAAKPAN
jgi:hypothetical protein